MLRYPFPPSFSPSVESVTGALFEKIHDEVGTRLSSDQIGHY